MELRPFVDLFGSFEQDKVCLGAGECRMGSPESCCGELAEEVPIKMQDGKGRALQGVLKEFRGQCNRGSNALVWLKPLLVEAQDSMEQP